MISVKLRWGRHSQISSRFGLIDQESEGHLPLWSGKYWFLNDW